MSDYEYDDNREHEPDELDGDAELEAELEHELDDDTARDDRLRAWERSHREMSGRVIYHGRHRGQGAWVRGRFTRSMGARDGDVDRFLERLKREPELRRSCRRQIERRWGIRFEDVRTVASIRGRPSRELEALRDRIAVAFATTVDGEATHAQRGRRVTRRTLLVLYGLTELQLDRLLAKGREKRMAEPKRRK